ncbi:hypothetical protein DPMN_155715 [Dreissena polymorpha]|uniref:Protein kinase domain-containing protein n=1 Tax=Dreissena polymorpha TaxID=45954 RepID=A0A9D4FRQ7_DREPO|nr:hypothetical protein DPMN_155715 [Dreissena polymorpha]
MIDRLKKIHEGLRKSVIVCQRRQLQEHYSWLDGLLQHVRKHALVRIQFANDAKRSNDDVKLAFGKLQRYTAELTKIKKDLKERVHSECTEMAMKLTQHLNQSSVKSDIKSRFYANKELRRPKNDIDTTKTGVKSHILQLIMTEIQKWEQNSKRYQFIATMINEVFEKKFQSLRREFGDVEQLVKIENEPDEKATESDTTMPTDFCLTTGDKAILAVTAPLWVPISIVAAFVALGVEAHDDKKLKDFETDCSPFLDAWLKQYLKELLKKKSIEKCVLDNYESILMRRIDQMSARIVSASMQADMVYLESILNDTRDSSEIVGEFTNIKTIVQGHIVSLKLFGLQYLAKDVANCGDITRVKEIGTGKHSEVYAAKYLEKDVALKVIKLFPATMFSRLAELELFRSLHHANIVSLLGVCYTDMLPGAVGSGMREQLSSFRLLILFDKCDTNLEEYVFNNSPFQCGNISQTSRTEASDFFCRTGQAICSAMFYIHWKGYVHSKIQLKNVLLQNGKVKLCGPTCTPDTNIDNGTKFLAPEVLAHQNIG